MEFETRSGNLNRAQKNWSAWAKTQRRAASPRPPRDSCNTGRRLTGPAELDEVDVAYQMKNVAPVIEEVEITPANYKFPAPMRRLAPVSNPTLTLPPLGAAPARSSTLASAGDAGIVAGAHLVQGTDRRALARHR